MDAGHAFITGRLRDLIMKKYVVIFTVVALLILAVGCTQPAPQQTVQPTATPIPTPARTVPQEPVVAPPALLTTGSVSPTISNTVSENTIHISKNGFDPADITVKTGTSVRWLNDDSTSDAALYNPTHRITIVNIKNSPLLSPGQSWSWIFREPGTFDYSDMIHNLPKGTVTVV
jgi:plastocyanin